MSGRLVILRHKSWHVWNQDNQEKVLRDERLEKEAEEEKNVNEKRKLQEKNLEVLSGEKPTTSDHHDGSRNAKEKSKTGIETVPDKLGELVSEKPWYMKPTSNSSDLKDEDKIDKEDPMKNYLHSSALAIDSNSFLGQRKGVSSFLSVNIDELRAKRLKREKVERKRAANLLAEQEIYGNYGKRKKI